MIQSYAPGRAELLGNHTDYNDGLVLAIAVDRGVTLTGTVRSDDALFIAAPEMGDAYEGSLAALAPEGEKTWANYLLGVVAQFQKRGLAVGGVDLRIESDLPPGAGLSSSAALETSTAFFLAHAFGHDALTLLERAKIGQAAEHQYVGVKCGLLDQIASIFSKAGQTTVIDCRSFEVRNAPLAPGVSFVIANSGVKHALVAGEYNERREACEEAARTLGLKALRDIDPETLEKRAGELSPSALKRARHVVGEIDRVARGTAFLEAGDMAAFGRLMFASHESSIVNFENSCPELDALVAAAKRVEGCHGARLSGGGFGGATINLVAAGREEALIQALEAAVPGTKCLVTKAADGARIL
ncbi:galactokinase [Verrucomicrobium sp. GAS474]|uniref:galactokinase n=1 Tax=Verrucomicrobium sp. GAS474 TaxID=1882831 RepID=UPI00087A5483|nr:galactokinase [Verrucomicrobium sp. GAS474]SDT98495.1 galactokinase [Verrucomicrobium sp. GAS474]